MPPAPSRIPTCLITGFLGSGKTSALLSLLPLRPPHERWAVLVNEYGMVSLDHLLLNDSPDQSDSVQVDELAGGCFCCTLSMDLPLALSRLIRRSQPHRIFIEPTGAGHPAAVIDMLRTGRIADQIELRSVICLVDPRDYQNPRITNSAVFHDQIQMADVVAINFSDKCSPAQTALCRQYVASLDPPKFLIAETTLGRLQPEWLDPDCLVARPPGFADAHRTDFHQHSASPTVPGDQLVRISSQPAAGRPVRFENAGLGQRACGWIFSPDDIFQRDLLLDLLGGLRQVLRTKGVFHCTDDWWTIQKRRDETRVERSAYRRDSRIEVILDEATELQWNWLENELLRCMS